eukprot:CAMPEP_0183343018 /NCGR_PEP_ID=MMETSP0164_2-20130417/9013_1 /TAXON_ID=221442 /ORGANISM="Coccolithus pelagicus ssp braarudi, Strain PLY182g" /LENGTH=379 /DNA_ID=CAMNT_0025513757 /DNA_START=48 /DNA_END=1187 /DNA_ORIENTATION=-
MASRTTSPGTICWLHGFGGIHANGRAAWPALVCDLHDGGAEVQAVRGQEEHLVKSFGDNAFVWCHSEALSSFDGGKGEIEQALACNGSKSVKRALRAALEHLRASSPTTPPAHKAAHPLQKRPAQGEELSAYECQRLETMRKILRVLESLGVASAADLLRLDGAPEKPVVDPAVLAARQAARAQERQARLLEAQAYRRHSTRMHFADPPKRFADEYRDLDKAMLEFQHARKVAKKAAEKAFSGKAGSKAGGKAGGKAEEPLSTEERATVSSAYAVASEWLDEMREYFSNKLSDANLRNVMKQVTALATGAGVSHTKDKAFFRRCNPVKLEEDMGALKVAAANFLRPEDDPGHGWRLTHPIGKLAIFQAYLHAKRSRVDM